MHPVSPYRQSQPAPQVQQYTCATKHMQPVQCSVIIIGGQRGDTRAGECQFMCEIVADSINEKLIEWEQEVSVK